MTTKPMSTGAKLILTICFADYNYFRTLYNGVPFVYLNGAPGENYLLSDNITKIELFPIARMANLLFGFEEKHLKTSPITGSQLLQNSQKILEQISKDLPEKSPDQLSFMALQHKEEFGNINNWDWDFFEDEYDDMVKAGISSLDIDLFHYAHRRDIEKTVEALRLGANPYINLYDDCETYYGTIISHLYGDDLFGPKNRFGGYLRSYYEKQVSLLTKKEWDDTERYNMYKGMIDHNTYQNPALEDGTMAEKNVARILYDLLVACSAGVMLQIIKKNCIFTPVRGKIPPHTPAYSTVSEPKPEPEPKSVKPPVTFTLAINLEKVWQESLEKSALAIIEKERRSILKTFKKNPDAEELPLEYLTEYTHLLVEKLINEGLERVEKKGWEAHFKEEHQATLNAQKARVERKLRNSKR